MIFTHSTLQNIIHTLPVVYITYIHYILEKHTFLQSGTHCFMISATTIKMHFVSSFKFASLPSLFTGRNSNAAAVFISVKLKFKSKSQLWTPKPLT